MFKKSSLVLIAFAVMILAAGCGSGTDSGTGPSDVPTATPAPATQNVTITFSVFNEFNQPVQADANGVWHMTAGKAVRVKIDFTNPRNVEFTGKLTDWEGWQDLRNETSIGTGGILPAGRNEVKVDITEVNGYHQTMTAVIVGE